MGGVEGVNANTLRICTEDMQGRYDTDTDEWEIVSGN
jgi:hypothetical protein